MTNSKEQPQEFWIDLDKKDYSEQQHCEYEVCFVEKAAYYELKAKLETAIKALEFYADVNSWETTKIDKTESNPIYLYRWGIIRDNEKFDTHSIGGKTARQALKEIKDID